VTLAQYLKALEPIKGFLYLVAGAWSVTGTVPLPTLRLGVFQLLIAYGVAVVPNAPPPAASVPRPSGLAPKGAS
jgi:hypothetical protein